MRETSSAKLRIGLLWHSFTNDNLGVGALSIANAQIIARAAEAIGAQTEFHVMGPGGRVLYMELCPGGIASQSSARPSEAANPFSRGQRMLARCDVVFDIGGGDSFTDIYGARRYGMIVGSKAPLRMRGVPYVLSPQTIGPFKSPLAARAARFMAKGARLVCSRDKQSTRHAREDLGLEDVLEVSDVAFGLQYEARTLPKSRPAFGLNVSGLLMQGGYDGKNQFGLAGDYPSLIRRIIRRVLDRGDYELHLVPHVMGAVEGDNAANDLLAKEFPEAVVAPVFGDPIEAKSYIAGLDAFAGSRMHATIAALSSGIACLGLAYSRKFQGLYETLGYDGNIDLASASPDETLAAIDRLLDERAAYAEAAGRARAEADRRLAAYEAAVRDVLTAL